MSNFDFSFVSSFARFMKEREKTEKNKKYVVKFSRSTHMSVDDSKDSKESKESKEYRESDIPVFEGTLDECRSFVKLQALDWMMKIIDIEDVYTRDISLTETWQRLPRVRLSMYDCQDEKSWSSYTYYEVYDNHYYEF